MITHFWGYPDAIQWESKPTDLSKQYYLSWLLGQIFGNDDFSGQGISIIKSKKNSKRFWWLLKLKNILFSINITAIGCWQVLSLSVVQMKGKQCQKPHGLDGIVDAIVHYMKYCFWNKACFGYFHFFFSLSSLPFLDVFFFKSFSTSGE